MLHLDNAFYCPLSQLANTMCASHPKSAVQMIAGCSNRATQLLGNMTMLVPVDAESNYNKVSVCQAELALL